MFDNDNDGCGMILLAVFGLVAVLVISTIANGFALSVLWGWFISPVFGLPALTIVQAIGLSMVVSYLTYQYIRDSGEKKTLTKSILTELVMAILRPALVLGLGAIVNLFV